MATTDIITMMAITTKTSTMSTKIITARYSGSNNHDDYHSYNSLGNKNSHNDYNDYKKYI